ncbi:ead/Ea22-like family protein [Escherichia coli]|uniref:ead/Ea22-like family protein n=1 Tax=Escherichia coli TaxID=562 RepID=UPI0038B69CB8
MSNIDKRALREIAEAAVGAHERLSVMPPDDIFDISLAEGTQLDADITALNALNSAANPATVLALLDELEAKDQSIAVLTESLKQTVSGYKSCLRTGHERILDLGGDCDAPEVMIAGNPDIQQAQKLIAAASGKGEAS